MGKFVLIKQEDYENLKSNLALLSEYVIKIMDNEVSNNWLDGNDICSLLKISKRTLAYYRANSILPYSYIGNKIYYHTSEVAKILKKNLKDGNT